MKQFWKKHRTVIITMLLMIVIGTCMHFVCELAGSENIRKILGVVFPVNETSWEHMKMLWYRGFFLTHPPAVSTGIFSVRESSSQPSSVRPMGRARYSLSGSYQTALNNRKNRRKAVFLTDYAVSGRASSAFEPK